MDYAKSIFNSNITNSKDNSSSLFLKKKHSLTFKPIFKSTSSLPIIESKSTDINSDEHEKSDIRQGRWLQSEHFRFLKGCLLYGNNWGEIKKCIKTRSSAQIRSHAQKYLIKLSKKYRFHPNFSTQNKNSNENDILIKEDYILEDYEIFPNEKIRELQIFAGIIPYKSIFEDKDNFNLIKESESKSIFSIEKIESSILGIFKFTGSKNLSELDLVENLQPRYLTLSISELKELENLGIEDNSLQIKKRRSSLKLTKRKISSFNKEVGINLNDINNFNSEHLRIPNQFNSNKSSEESLKSFKSNINIKISPNHDIKQSSNFQIGSYFSNFDEYMMNCYLQDQYIKKLVKEHIDNSISSFSCTKEIKEVENKFN